MSQRARWWRVALRSASILIVPIAQNEGSCVLDETLADRGDFEITSSVVPLVR